VEDKLEKLAKLLVNYSTKVKKGEFVLISSDEVALPLVKAIYKEAIIKGAHVEYILNSGEFSEIKYKYSSEDQLKHENIIMKHALSKADVCISIIAERNTKTTFNADPEKIRISMNGAKSSQEIFTKRMGSGELRWVGTEYPTYAHAQEAKMSLDEYEDFVYGAGMLNLDDPISYWEEKSKKQEKICEFLNTKKEFRVISKDTDIKIYTEGRKWINCNGTQNFPDGEVFCSPCENKIDGVITFSYPSSFFGKDVEGIRLEVKDGKIISATAKKGEDFLNELIKTDEGSSFFGEFAIGTNYNIEKFTNNTLFDEKIGGTIHMAIGESLEESGGKNRSTIHWDLVNDMHEGKIFADDELIYENGKFMNKDFIIK